jgi:WD40 repeat protein
MAVNSSGNPMSANNDNILLVTAGYDRTIRFWQANTAAIYRTIMHEDSVRMKICIENL